MMDSLIARIALGKNNGSRSTVLHSGLWLVGLFLTSFIFVSKSEDKFVIIVFIIIISIIILVILFLLVYFSIKNPDYLRSEKFQTDRIAMENGYYGDSNNPLLQEDYLKIIPKLSVEVDSKLLEEKQKLDTEVRK